MNSDACSSARESTVGCKNSVRALEVRIHGGLKSDRRRIVGGNDSGALVVSGFCERESHSVGGHRGHHFHTIFVVRGELMAQGKIPLLLSLRARHTGTSQHEIFPSAHQAAHSIHTFLDLGGQPHHSSIVSSIQNGDRGNGLGIDSLVKLQTGELARCSLLDLAATAHVSWNASLSFSEAGAPPFPESPSRLLPSSAGRVCCLRCNKHKLDCFAPESRKTVQALFQFGSVPRCATARASNYFGRQLEPLLRLARLLSERPAPRASRRFEEPPMTCNHGAAFMAASRHVHVLKMLSLVRLRIYLGLGRSLREGQCTHEHKRGTLRKEHHKDQLHRDNSQETRNATPYDNNTQSKYQLASEKCFDVRWSQEQTVTDDAT